jgi:hypothetical protein
VASTTIRISEKARDDARELARATGKSISGAVEEAIRRERRRLFFEHGRRAVEAVKADPRAMAEEAAELAIYENTLMDSLEDEPVPE